MEHNEPPLVEPHADLANFIHGLREPRYFVLRMKEGDRHYAEGYRFAVQLLNDDGQGEVVLYFKGPRADYRSKNLYVPSAVITAALRQEPGKRDYVDDAGQRRSPF